MEMRAGYGDLMEKHMAKKKVPFKDLGFEEPMRLNKKYKKGKKKLKK